MTDRSDTPNHTMLWTTLDEYRLSGFSLVELHRVDDDGACSCEHAGAAEHFDQAGKHPVHAGWRKRVDEMTPDEMAAMIERGSNVGIRTGLPSRVWVLDVDPKNGGWATLASLEARHGKLPVTRAHKTGSDGVHLLWRLPPDWLPTNSRGRLAQAGPGLDVRGDGGQIVVPPSRSAKGDYTLAVDAPIIYSPEWLLDYIRPIRIEETRQASHATPALPAFSHGVAPGVAPGPAEWERVTTYARTAVGRELGELGQAVRGERNTVAYEVACNLLEFANAPWAGLNVEVAWGLFVDAGRSTELDDAELAQVWNSASRKVGARARVYPSLGGVSLDAPFVPTQSVIASAVVPPFVLPGTGQGGIDAVDPVDAFLDRWLSSDDLDDLLELEPLVRGWLSLDSISWLVGHSGTMKSFVALSVAAAVATGQDWHSLPVHKGTAWYVVAEGSRGMRRRVRAWEQHHNEGKRILPHELRFLPEPVQIVSPEWDLMIAAAGRVRPALVVLDTQARMTVGVEENSAKDMGLVVDRAEALRRATGACVLLVHHLSKAGGSQRGSGATYGAAQTELTVTREEPQGSRRGSGARPVIWVNQTKQKDDDELSPLKLTTVGVPGAVETDEYGLSVPAKGSVVLVLADTVETPESAVLAEEGVMTQAMLDLVGIMRSTFAEGVGGTKAEAKGLWAKTSRHPATFYRAWGKLIDAGMIGKVVGTFGSYRWIPIEERVEQTGQIGMS